MSRRDTVRIYADGKFQRHISPAEASSMSARSELDPVFEIRRGRQVTIGYQVSKAIASDSHHTACSLTRSDTVINATAGRSLTRGLSDERRRKIDESRAGRGMGPLPEVDRVQQVQERVQMYPYEFDEKATSIFNCRQREAMA